MSRGPGKVQRWLLAEVAKPTPAWPPWFTIEVLAARYVGVEADDIVMVRSDDDMWRAPWNSYAGVKDPTAYDHLIGLSVERAQELVDSQRLGRAVVESVRRAVKALAAGGHVNLTRIDVANRGGRYVCRYRDSRGAVVPWVGRAVVGMLACRRPLTEAEIEAEAPREAARQQRYRAAMAMLRGAA